jgi:thiol-disulfide isomerase/thioredoxin
MSMTDPSSFSLRENISMHTAPTRLIIGLAAMVGAFAAVADGQESRSSDKSGSLVKLLEDYRHKRAALEKQEVADLVALADRLKGEEAVAAYRAAFDLAVSKGLYSDVAPAAQAFLKKNEGDPQTLALAESIVLIAAVDQKDFDASLEELKRLIETFASIKTPTERRLSPPLLFAVGEAYLQRLLRSGRYDVARKACAILVEEGIPAAVREYFAGRRARLELVGQLAPEIKGTDVDGKPISLADFKGQVVLVDFWATWCPPCVASFPMIREIAMRYKDQGVTVLGVNLDSLTDSQSTSPEAQKQTLATVRSFLLGQRASWPNLVGEGAEAAAKAYYVTAVPANLLVGRDGKVLHIEIGPENLDAQIQAALGKARPKAHGQ